MTIAANEYPPISVSSEHGSVETARVQPIDGLYNDSVHVYSWDDLSAFLPNKKGSEGKVLLDHMSGEAMSGELVAIMGPSGSGKTMLLNRLAHRAMPPKAKLSGSAYINDVPANLALVRATSSYVEQQDHLIGSLTTVETLGFAAKLGLNQQLSSRDLRSRIDHLLSAFGLIDQANMIIGTPIQKGLSGGQKRRVSVASQLITSPKILFLDEPTSGLDSVASYEVVSYLKKVARDNNLIVIASIHQPSTSTFNVFDKVYLLAKGRMCFGGPLRDIAPHFQSLGFELPSNTNPAEWILELVDTDFAHDKAEGWARHQRIVDGWRAVPKSPSEGSQTSHGLKLPPTSARTRFYQPVHLLRRSWIKSYRDLIAYWIRVGMYTCLAILVGTCWLRLGHSQNDVQPRVTALFFGGAFLSFMAVAYIPAYIEDQATFFKERANGLYGPTSFLIANFLIGLPYLFIISTVFSVISYWLVNLWPTATGFWTYVGFLLLDLMAAESLIVLISSIVPNFIVALALSAFANGLWMCVNGFLVPETILNVFWKSWVTKINYQNWVFRGMMWNEFHAQTFQCAGQGNCAYPAGPDGTTIPGKSVLAYYGYDSGALGAFAGYILAIIAVYRLLAWVVLTLRR